MRDVAWGFFYGTVNFDDVLGTMHRLAAGELPGKVMVRPEVRSR